MSTTKYVCAVMHIEKGDVLTRARAQRVSQDPAAAAEGLGASTVWGWRPSPRRPGMARLLPADVPNRS
jgi:hypothetical protein